MNKKITKIINIIFISTLMLHSLPIYALTKDETVYTKLNNDGSVKMTLVNNHIKNPNNLETLTDETDLLNILNINGKEKFTQNGTTLTWESQGKDIFYQGSTEKPLPIATKIKYYLNGEEKKLEDIIGANGKITIEMYFENKEERIVNIQGKNETLYTPFVVTSGLILKGETNKEITINNGRVIDNGESYIIGGLAVPGLSKSLEIENLKNLDEIKIEFETTKFELPNIYIIMTPKILEEKDLEIFDKMSILYNNVNKLKESIDQIENGSNELLTGTKQINDGNKAVYETLEMITSKVDKLKNGTNEINKGVEKLVSTLSSINLLENLDVSKIPELITANNVAIQTLENLNTNNQYDKVLYALSEENKILTSIKDDILPNLANLQKETENLKQLSAGSTTLYEGTKTLYEGLKELTSNTKTLSEGTNNLYEGLNNLNNGIHTFNNEGITSINNYLNWNVLPLQNKTKELIKLSNDYETFTMKNEGSSSSTKFIMSIDGVKVNKEQKKTKETPKENTSLWQKIKNLFN